MNLEELSFLNQQLAAMLKSGMPLEGSLRQISASMHRGSLRDETEALERDFAQGMPLEEAIGRRKLPELYIALVRVGAKSGDLPGVLTMVADYYRGLAATWTRLKGLLVYPALVLLMSLVVSGLMAVLFTHVVADSDSALGGMMGRTGPRGASLLIRLWLPVILLGLLTAVFLVALGVRSVRHQLRWRVPAFRDASLAQLASAMSLMLGHGCDARTALQLVENTEQNPAARRELRGWRERLAGGTVAFADVAQGRLVPALFVWLVSSAGENWAAGFRRAADVYGARAKYRTELVLYAALPAAVVLVAAIVATEIAPIMHSFVMFMNELSNPDF